MTMIHSQFADINDSIGLLQHMPDLACLIDQNINSLCKQILINSEELQQQPLVQIDFSDTGQSEVLGQQIRIVVPELPTSKLADHCLLLLRHEWVHYLTEQFWLSQQQKQMMVLLWEGLPIYLGDHWVRQRQFGWGYDQLCKVLKQKESLLELWPLCQGNYYYAYRHDFRVDIQAGAFTGFLVQRFGMKALRALFQNYQPPTPKHPILLINPLFQKVLGQTLTELEKLWHQYLESNVCEHPDTEKIIARQNLQTPSKSKSLHCAFCYMPLNSTICSACGASKNIPLIPC